jgi:group I intron endonuclease
MGRNRTYINLGYEPCVYKMTIGNKFYIGSTTVNLARRAGRHMHMLKKGLHTPLILEAYKACNEVSFEVLELCGESECKDLENKYLQMYFDHPDCLNQARDSRSTRGVLRTEEHKAALSKAHKGKRYRLGIPNSPEAREKISKGLKKAWAEGRMNHVPTAKNQVYGEDHCHAKLTEENVFEIYRLRDQGLTHQSIADTFNVTRENITIILNGRAWKRQYNKYYAKENNNA